MAKVALPFLLLSILGLVGVALGATSSSSSSTNFIKNKCSATQYPALCVKSLSAYANKINQSPQQLAQAALAVSLASAKSTKAFVTKLYRPKGLKPREIQALNDCKEEIDDTVSRLSKSADELKRAGQARSKEFKWRISNVETWVSAAITDDNTCTDGFAGRALDGKVKASIRAQFVNVVQCTSNALALINQYASTKH
ncbi:hypothetical protein Ancab_010223 [Ancistrocladus abbreviatus]